MPGVASAKYNGSTSDPALILRLLPESDRPAVLEQVRECVPDWLWVDAPGT